MCIVHNVYLQIKYKTNFLHGFVSQEDILCISTSVILDLVTNGLTVLLLSPGV